MPRLVDLFNERIGWYRFAEFLRGNVIAWSVKVVSPSRLSIDRHVVIQRGAILHCGGKPWCDFTGRIQIGKGVVIGPYCVLYGAGGLEIGDYVHFGPSSQVMTQSGRNTVERFSSVPSRSFSPVRIGEGSWIGAGAVILGGSQLGRGVTVSPNSVVAGGTVPDYAVVVGNPARVLRIDEVSQ